MLLTRRFWLGTMVTVGFLFLLLWKVDIGDMGKELQDADYRYFVPAVLLYFCALGFRSVRWRYLMLHLKSVSPWRLYPVVAIGYLANNILPVRLGELVRAHYLGEKEEINKASALATIGVERVLDGLTLLLFAAVIWPFLPWTKALRDEGGSLKTEWVVLSVLMALMFIAGFLFLILVARSPSFGRRLAHLVASMSPRGLRPRVESLIYLLSEGLGALRSPRKLAMVSLLSAPVWLTEAAMYYILAISFDLNQPFEVILLVTATSNLATAIPSSVGGIGPFEVVAKSTLIAFGVGGEAAVAYAFFVHIVALWLPVNILGLLFLWKENLSIAQLVRGREVELSSRESEGVSPLPQTQGSSPSAYGDQSTFTREGEEAQDIK